MNLISLPCGGMPGAERLRDSDALDAFLRKQDARHASLAAVCASPSVILKSMGIMRSQATCYPAPPFVEALGDIADGDVVRDGHITTSRGPGTSLKFALDLADRALRAREGRGLRAQMARADRLDRVRRRRPPSGRAKARDARRDLAEEHAANAVAPTGSSNVSAATWRALRVTT